jgi:hypothetical protein
MDALLAALQQGGARSWLVLIGGLVVALILLRLVFELASVAVKIGCAVLFLLAVAYVLFMIFGRG